MRPMLMLIVVITVVAVFGVVDRQPVGAQVRLPAVSDITLGISTNGQPITAVKIGDGPRKLVLVGDTHGGPEANTYRLLRDLIVYFRAHPHEVPLSVRLYLIPTLNPDGLALDTRFNSRGVDLNRNMNTNLDACRENDWRTEVNGAYGVVSETGGAAPETEVESRLIRDFLLDASAAIFYHSAGGELFPPFCEHAPSNRLAQFYAQTAGYRYTRYYPKYLITGGMHDWAASLGIVSFTPELWNGEDSDTEANLAAIQAVLQQADELLPLPEDRREGGVVVPAVLWRYWKAHNGTDRFGQPLAAAQVQNNRLTQYFTNAVLELHPEAADTPGLVQLAAIPSELPALDAQGLHEPISGVGNLAPLFTALWQRQEGSSLYGAPVSPITTGRSLVDGQPSLVQYFERARFEHNGRDPSQPVRLSPLGWFTWHRRHIDLPTVAQQIR